VLVLEARQRMQVEDGVDLVSRTDLDGTVEQAEPSSLSTNGRSSSSKCR